MTDEELLECHQKHFGDINDARFTELSHGEYEQLSDSEQWDYIYEWGLAMKRRDERRFGNKNQAI